MFRYLLTIGFLVSAGCAFSQSIFSPNTQPEYPTSILMDFKGGYTPVYDAKSFADSTLNKVLLEPVKPLLWSPLQIDLKEQPRANEHIGSDGKPGIPLPAIHEEPEKEIIWSPDPVKPEKK